MWTKAESALVEKYYNQGKSDSEIAFLLKKTKNAVIGKRDRLGLERDIFHPKRGKNPMSHPSFDAPTEKSKPLSEVEKDDCRYPVTKVLYCCYPTYDGSVYCRDHEEIAYVRKRKAD